MEGAGSGGHRPCYTSGSGQCSFRTSLSSMLDIASEVVEEGSLPVQDKVFVAVAEKLKCGKSTLLWALQNLAKDGSKIVIAHVHCPAVVSAHSLAAQLLHFFIFMSGKVN